MKLKKNGLNANWDKVREQITKEYGVKKEKMYKVSYYHYFNEQELKEFMKLQSESGLDEDQLDEHDSLGQMLVSAVKLGDIDWSNISIKEEEV